MYNIKVILYSTFNKIVHKTKFDGVGFFSCDIMLELRRLILDFKILN
jgi:hypothetical protein